MPSKKLYSCSNIVLRIYVKNINAQYSIIVNILSDNTKEKTGAERTIAINIKDDKIRFILGEDSGYSSGSCNIEEKLTNYSQSYLTKDIDLKLGTDVYIYHAVANTSGLFYFR
ncbi:hypothetical protein [Clostridium sp. C2-6-12]|uniref:hypothetical protein n=1 Tax=Clostridium sp. C2-6-12 TaxID=2698832 RepID=UPI00136EC9C2|nr:hypothetical protein [Clostridium sp. C2-6-12]